MQAALALGVSAVGQEAKDPLGFWLVPHFVHADAIHNVPTVLLPLKVHALKWGGHKIPDRL